MPGAPVRLAGAGAPLAVRLRLPPLRVPPDGRAARPRGPRRLRPPLRRRGGHIIGMSPTAGSRNDLAGWCTAWHQAIDQYGQPGTAPDPGHRVRSRSAPDRVPGLPRLNRLAGTLAPTLGAPAAVAVACAYGLPTHAL